MTVTGASGRTPVVPSAGVTAICAGGIVLVEEDDEPAPTAGGAVPSAAALGVTAEQPETSEPTRPSAVTVSAQRRVVELTS